jgi:hypothetical protein
MTTLPDPLKPWSAALQLFPHELAVGLGAWLPRLAMALGPLRTNADEGHDEPDGFDGLTRKGPYERLLPAEWALADAFPDEFNRRAASGEHAFFRLAFRSPAGDRRCLALLDSGPSQLGTPRLAHLAALVVLERRAREAKAEFLWGVLQQPPGRCLTRIDASAVHHWLLSRCATEPSEDDAGGWRAFFGPAKTGDELWLIGGHRVSRLAPTSALVVREAERSSLEVDVRPRAQAARKVSLPLPSDELCTRLIRDPLRREAPLGKARPPESNLCFVGGATRLAWLTPGGELVVQVVPGAPGEAAPAKTFRPPPGEQLVAIGWDRGLVTVTQQGTALRWNWYSKRGGLRGQGAWHLHASDSHPALGRPRMLGECLPSGWLVTARGELVCTELNRTYRVMSLRAAGVIAPRQRLVAVTLGTGEARVEWNPPMAGEKPGDNRVRLQSAELSSEASVVFGFDQLSRLGVIAAVSLGNGRWQVARLLEGPKLFQRIAPVGSTVVGVTMAQNDSLHEPGLLAIEADGQTLSAFFGDTVRRVLRMETRITRCAVSAHSSHVALQTADDMLSLYSLRRQQMVLRLRCGDDP